MIVDCVYGRPVLYDLVSQFHIGAMQSGRVATLVDPVSHVIQHHETRFVRVRISEIHDPDTVITALLQAHACEGRAAEDRPH